MEFSDEQTRFEENVKVALEQWHEHSEASTSLSHLRLYKQLQNRFNYAPRQTTNQIITNGLTALEIEDEKQAKLLQLRFLDRETIYATGNQLNMAESTVYLNQRKALLRLTELLFNMETQAQEDFLYIVENRLEPTTHTYLVGMDKHIEHLTQILSSQAPPWIISIEGLGGMGKTTLARTIAQQMIDKQVFDDFGWATTRQSALDLGGEIVSVTQPLNTTIAVTDSLFCQLFEDSAALTSLSHEQKNEMLQTLLKQVPHLIIIDNLESLQDIESLLPTLKNMSNPSKFLLTSRERHYSEASVYRFRMPPLGEEHTIQFLRQEAQLSNLPHMEEARDDELRPIYEIVGGNPLALRLVVGQIYAHTLDTILNNLITAQSEKVESLYTYIYRGAWDSLNEEERLALLAMPLVTNKGGDLSFLSATSGLALEKVSQGLDKLIRLNLVDSHGGLNERRYTIHNLTRSFLQEQVAKWEIS